MRHDEVLHVLARSHLIAFDEIDVAGQQPERRRAAGNAAQHAVVRAGQPRRQLRSRKAQHQHVAGRAVRAVQRLGEPHERGLAMTEHDLAPALTEEHPALRIDHETDVFGGIVVFARPRVARALQRA
jgi:hypothetical protein